MSSAGYSRCPTVHENTIVFVSEDDLWEVPVTGGIARRLTAGLGGVKFPFFSPDGQRIAFGSTEEGHQEVYVMEAHGGQPERLTHLGAFSNVCGWDPDGNILFTSHYGQPFRGDPRLFRIAPPPVAAWSDCHSALPCASPSGSGGRSVLGRYAIEIAWWKRYRGGRTGKLWIDNEGDGNFRPLLDLPGNMSAPSWIDDRIFFLSDHEGIGNLYSCVPSGEDVRRHTHHDEFYARNPSTDGTTIVYHAGADLYVYRVESDKTARVDVDYRSPRTQRNRKFVDAKDYLEGYSPHPDGHSLLITARGHTFSMGNWEGAVTQLVHDSDVRQRHAQYLNDGRRVVVVSDTGRLQALEIHDLSEPGPGHRIADLDLGNVVDMKPSPVGDKVLMSNHRDELFIVDLIAEKKQPIASNGRFVLSACSWSPDGRWVAYSYHETRHTSHLRIFDTETGDDHPVTRPVLQDFNPVFDPEGEYLYFLSKRVFNPVYDNVHFGLGFPRGEKPYLITLKKETTSPFLPPPSAPRSEDQEDKKDVKRDVKVKIDFDGIEDRVIPFPVDEAKCEQLSALPGKVLFTTLPVEGALGSDIFDEGPPPAKATLRCYDFDAQTAEVLVDKVTDFAVSRDGKTLVYRVGDRLRAIPAGTRPNADGAMADDTPGRKSGWIDLTRIKLSVQPAAEWKQMYGEAWRLQRDHFWSRDLSKVDWQLAHDRYRPLLDRVSTREEFSDLLWEMQGELGTSHAYVIGGDLRKPPSYGLGFLAADFAWDDSVSAWRIDHIVGSDSWEENAYSPLRQPGVNVREGDVVLAVCGRRLTKVLSPMAALVHLGHSEIELTVADAKGDAPRTVRVRTLRNEMPARYREWVEGNRRWVHEQSDGKVGYLHIPNMMAPGYSEFHRYFMGEIDRLGLVVDVRFNGGGHVSQLLLEKLARRRLGYVVSRWYGTFTKPTDAPAGPMAAITNENAGSDGDIFSHTFKMCGLGPLIGTRTWGGVVGIWPRNRLKDAGMTTQPEFSNWFTDVGWDVENHGAEPDIVVDISPQEFRAGRDPQLERAVREVMAQLESFDEVDVASEGRPRLPLPTLPPRREGG